MVKAAWELERPNPERGWISDDRVNRREKTDQKWTHTLLGGSVAAGGIEKSRRREIYMPHPEKMGEHGFGKNRGETSRFPRAKNAVMHRLQHMIFIIRIDRRGIAFDILDQGGADFFKGDLLELNFQYLSLRTVCPRGGTLEHVCEKPLLFRLFFSL